MNQEKDPKIVKIRHPQDRNTSLHGEEFQNMFQQMESQLDNAMGNLEHQNLSDRDHIRKEVQEIIQGFEDRMNKRLEEMESTSKKPEDEMFQKIKKLIHLLKSFINFPDFELLARADEVDEFGLDPDFEAQVMPVFEFLHDKYWRVDTHGLEHIPNQGRALIVPNHAGVLAADGAMIKVVIREQHPSRRSVRFLVEDFVYHFPYMGMFMSRFGGVRACQENATRLLNNDQLVVVFPEGVKGVGKLYKDRYRLQRFGRGGVIRLAIKTQTPIIPTAVIGSEEIFPLLTKSNFLTRPLGIPFVPVTPFFPALGPLGMVPLPSKWSIHFGEPMAFDQYDPEDAKDRLLVSKLNEALRDRIQEMIKEQLIKRVSIWF